MSKCRECGYDPAMPDAYGSLVRRHQAHLAGELLWSNRGGMAWLFVRDLFLLPFVLVRIAWLIVANYADKWRGQIECEQKSGRWPYGDW